MMSNLSLLNPRFTIQHLGVISSKKASIYYKVSSNNYFSIPRQHSIGVALRNFETRLKQAALQIGEKYQAMRLMKLSIFLILGCSFSLSVSAQAELPHKNELELNNVLSREWTWFNQNHPISALYLGEHSQTLWPDHRLPQRERLERHYKSVLSELTKIQPDTLSATAKINLALFQQQLSWQNSLFYHKLDLFIMNQREGLHTLASLSSSIDFRSLKDYEDWVLRLEAVEDYVDREIEALQEAIHADRVQPKVITQRIIERVEIQVKLHNTAEQSPFFTPFLQAETTLRSKPRFQTLSHRAQKVIETDILRAYKKLDAFLKGPYLKASPKKIGLGRLTGGPDAYQFLIQRYTTTEKTAEEIHRLGLQEVARIREEMEQIKAGLEFPGTLESFFEHLRTDPQHYTRDPDELLRRYRSFTKRVDAQMPRFFKSLPRRPYGVEPIPEYIAPATTTAYYLPGANSLSGTYYVNLYKPETRALFEIPALSLHEAVPGHHHQISLAQELTNLPAFRTESTGFGDYTVFVEGWALYAESLGEEMGLYKDPYDKFGKLTYEMWRAIRLVVDTGIHSKNWTRQQAIRYFLDNSPKSRLDVTNEVDRYISWPGQALAYKMGELEIKKLRAKAESSLGKEFDIREFHDVILKDGAVPLKLLKQQVDKYIQEKQRL